MNLRTGFIIGLLVVLGAVMVPSLAHRWGDTHPDEAAVERTDPTPTRPAPTDHTAPDSTAPDSTATDAPSGASRQTPSTSPTAAASPSSEGTTAGGGRVGDYPQDSTTTGGSAEPGEEDLPEIPSAGDLSDREISEVLSSRMAHRRHPEPPVGALAEEAATEWLAADLRAAARWESPKVRAVEAVDPLGPAAGPTEVTVVAVWSNARGNHTALHQSELQVRRKGSSWIVVP